MEGMIVAEVLISSSEIIGKKTLENCRKIRHARM
jgi:hypothetical protein